jgi:hypothetical protein
MFFIAFNTDLFLPFSPETQDSLSDDALLPLKSYKYSAVDKSPISNYILRHYVRTLEPRRGSESY